MRSDEVRILITGDFYGGNRINDLIMRDQYSKIFNDFLPYIQSSDISITNLESPLTSSDNPISKTGPVLKSNPNLVNALKFAGFNLVTLANNHIMDYGKIGLEETIHILERNEIDYVGAGLNFQKASETKHKTLKDKKIALINIAENEWSTTKGNQPGAHPLDPMTNFNTISQAKRSADFVFIIVHGGHEMYNLPSPRMKQTYRFLIDAGADAVVGHHTHCFSGYEIYKEKIIIYSLGNFLFDSKQQRNTDWNRGYAVQFKINDKIEFELIPYIQNDSSAGLALLGSDQKEVFFKELSRLNGVIEDDTKLAEKFVEYINKVSKSYNSYLEPHSYRILHFLQNRNLLPSLLSKKKKRLYNNLIRCESHRDVILNLLNSELDGSITYNR